MMKFSLFVVGLTPLSHTFQRVWIFALKKKKKKKRKGVGEFSVYSTRIEFYPYRPLFEDSVDSVSSTLPY